MSCEHRVLAAPHPYEVDPARAGHADGHRVRQQRIGHPIAVTMDERDAAAFKL